MTRREIAWSVLALLVAAVLVYAFFSFITAKNAYAEQEDFCRKAAQYGIRCAALTPPPASRPTILELRETFNYTEGDSRLWNEVRKVLDKLVERMRADGCRRVKEEGWRQGDMLIVSVLCTRR